MVLTAHGVAVDGPVEPVAIEALVGNAERRATRILAVSDLVSVGSVDPGQRLDFAAVGLTLVYGENGSGKSSYARVLRRACRSSAKPVEILPNVLKSGAATSEPASALLEISLDDKTRIISRSVNAPPEPDLADVSVFDSDCASVYADEETEITYTPSGLRLLERLVGFQAQLKKRIDQEITRLENEALPIDGFDPSTKAGALVTALTDHVSVSTIDALAAVKPAELARLEELRAQLAAAKATDPVSAANRHEKRADLANRLAGDMRDAAEALDDSVVRNLVTLNCKIEQLKADSASLAQALSHSVSRSISGPEWKAMWGAAHAYAKKGGRGAGAFPPAPEDQDSTCPLCQQVLPKEARERVQRLDEFFRGRVESEIGELSVRRDEILARIALTDWQSLERQASALLTGEEALEANLSRFTSSASERAARISASGSSTEIQAPPLSPQPVDELSAWSEASRRLAAKQRAFSNPDGARSAAREVAELEDRIRLHQRREAVVARIETLKRLAKLRDASRALVTTGLSRKIGTFTESAVTAQLRERLEAELKALRCTQVPVSVGARGMKGRTKVSLQLDATRKVDLGEVLSEGEQRAVALAFFLAEIGVADHGGGVILDDPVSSLDHARRSHVARRLVEEAGRRQVIVFTHDIVFLHELQALAPDASVPYQTRVVRRVAETAGVTSKDLPWIAQKVKARVGYLKGELQRITAAERKAEPECHRREAKSWFEMLRETWERAVEEHLFNGVVGRFQPGIQTLRLSTVNVTSDMTAAVERGMTRASEWIHDQAPALGKPAPTSLDMKASLDELEAFLSQVKR
jgi:energy-coupling factor transporter ATP-binding protein EcfA2